MGSLLENEPYSLSLLQKGGRNFDDSGSRIIISIRETGNYAQVARNEPVYIYIFRNTRCREDRFKNGSAANVYQGTQSSAVYTGRFGEKKHQQEGKVGWKRGGERGLIPGFRDVLNSNYRSGAWREARAYRAPLVRVNMRFDCPVGQ